MKDREQYYIDLYDSFNTGYNCSEKVDNPRYTLKNKKKKDTQIKIDKLYNEFIELYDPNRIKIGYGKTFLNRLLEKHYKPPTYNQVNSIIRWFYNNYNEEYKANILCRGYYILDVYDKNDIRFVIYVYKDKRMFSYPDDIKLVRNYLIDKGLYDEKIHYIVDNDNII